MVRIPIPNRLKSYGGNGSTQNSRSTSPVPGLKRSNTSESSTMDPNSPKVNGLMLKVVVIKVRSPCVLPSWRLGGGEVAAEQNVYMDVCSWC